MRNCTIYLFILAAFVIAGCDRPSSQSRANQGSNGDGSRQPSVAVIDLDRVAAAGQKDKEIEDALRSADQQLQTALRQQAENFQNQLRAKAQEFGEDMTPAQRNELQQMQNSAEQQVQQSFRNGQNRLNQLRVTLITQFRDQVRPTAWEIARQQGASALLVLNESVLAYDGAIDITDKVIGQMVFESAANSFGQPAQPAPPIPQTPGFPGFPTGPSNPAAPGPGGSMPGFDPAPGGAPAGR